MYFKDAVPLAERNRSPVAARANTASQPLRAPLALAVGYLQAAVQADYTVLGGGLAKRVRKLPADVVLGDNSKAFLGGFRLWQKPTGQLQQSAQRGIKRRKPAAVKRKG